MARIAITGASGYIGTRLVSAALSSGHEVLALSRRPISRCPRLSWQQYDLSEAGSLKLPQDIVAVYHLAAETKNASGSIGNELVAAQRLIDAVKLIGAKLIFVSSQTSAADAPTPYGRTKWQIERMVLDSSGWVVRPGLVYGGPELGLFGELCRYVDRSPLIPIFLPSPRVQLIHVDDLAKALLTCPDSGPPAVLCIADPYSIDFSSFLIGIARTRIGRFRLMIPVPTFMVVGARIIVSQRLYRQFGLERLASLFALKQMDTSADLLSLSLKLRPMLQGMTRSGSKRRQLLPEARAVFGYLGFPEAKKSLLGKYVRAIETVRNGDALLVPNVVLAYPHTLALLDDLNTDDVDFRRELTWRLNAALALYEATCEGARRFQKLASNQGCLANYLLLSRAITLEIGRRLAQLLIGPFLRRAYGRRPRDARG